MVKKCTKCNIDKELEGFYKCKSSPDGLKRVCKQCEKKYAEDNKEAISERNKKYRQKPEFKEKEKIRHKKRAIDKKQEIYESNKKWREANKEKMREYNRNWHKNRRATDISFKIAHRMRSRLKEALVKNWKTGSTQDLLGCTFDEFKMYFASLFIEKMTWGKFMNGEIHIDHKIPCCAFDLSKIEEQRKCFHYSNLQPMWDIANKKKNGEDRKIAKERLANL
jgi:hypothetical protein